MSRQGLLLFDRSGSSLSITFSDEFADIGISNGAGDFARLERCVTKSELLKIAQQLQEVANQMVVEYQIPEWEK